MNVIGKGRGGEEEAGGRGNQSERGGRGHWKHRVNGKLLSESDERVYAKA